LWKPTQTNCIILSDARELGLNLRVSVAPAVKYTRVADPHGSYFSQLLSNRFDPLHDLNQAQQISGFKPLGLTSLKSLLLVQ
jgi:hypothetical protein